MAGPFCFRTPRTLRRSAPPSWATWRGLAPEFAKRNCKVIGLKRRPGEQPRKWAADIEETQGHKVNYPMIGDPELKIAKLYDMLPADRRDHFRRPHGSQQCHRPHRVHRGSGQENQADAELPDEHRPQLRRSCCACSIRCNSRRSTRSRRR